MTTPMTTPITTPETKKAGELSQDAAPAKAAAKAAPKRTPLYDRPQGKDWCLGNSCLHLTWAEFIEEKVEGGVFAWNWIPRTKVADYGYDDPSDDVQLPEGSDLLMLAINTGRGIIEEIDVGVTREQEPEIYLWISSRILGSAL